jgi:hypothetical protein
MLVITKFGRTGNNLCQILKAIYKNLTEYKHDRILIGELKSKGIPIFANFPTVLTFPEFVDNPDNKIAVKSDFWEIDVPTDIANEIAEKYIVPYMNYSTSDLGYINFEEDLIIHIRSGDVFFPTFNINTYVQPPLWFYKHAIGQRKYNKIFIVTEGSPFLNPVIYALKNLYDNIVVLDKNPIDVDIRILLNAKWFIHSNTTLCYIVNLLNKRRDGDGTVYVNEWTSLNNKWQNIQKIETSDYYKIRFKSPQHRNITMLTYEQAMIEELDEHREGGDGELKALEGLKETK